MEEINTHIIDKAFRATWNRLNAILCNISIDLINESTFRFLFIEELLKIKRNLQLQIEWKKVDLLVQSENKNILVEFKFYTHKYTKDLKFNQLKPKGGAGNKNFGEFEQCKRKLENFKDNSGEIHEKYIVLVYQNKIEPKLKQTDFHGYYSNIGNHLDRLEQENYFVHGCLIQISDAPMYKQAGGL